MITVDYDTLTSMLETAYAMGFAASGEGYNAEYPFSDGIMDYEDDEDWCASRDHRIGNFIGMLKGIAEHGEKA